MYQVNGSMYHIDIRVFQNIKEYSMKISFLRIGKKQQPLRKKFSGILLFTSCSSCWKELKVPLEI